MEKIDTALKLEISPHLKYKLSGFFSSASCLISDGLALLVVFVSVACEFFVGGVDIDILVRCLHLNQFWIDARNASSPVVTPLSLPFLHVSEFILTFTLIKSMNEK